ncbi:hypothetical protein NECAME_01575 [Necator americanus]|uniref:G-protein coupled receptors family 1 profile domain-containing protein n=1 Tax=Necator americanus TaxID=51031 RepID=W2TT93_NECAM|nr:hypothetical protein NECAME_01575 [Necator americanus]ETN85013.1 hypothetical protein NECAME_01575 [Necator americanus]
MILNVTVHFLTWVTLSGSSLSLILLNLDKLLYFKYPLRYSAYVTKRCGIILALTVWACCLIFVAGAWYFECFKCGENCSSIHLLHDRWGMYLLFSISVCVMPTLTSLAVALYIVKVVSTHRKKLAEDFQPSDHSYGVAPIPLSSFQPSSRHIQKRNKDYRFIRIPLGPINSNG